MKVGKPLTQAHAVEAATSDGKSWWRPRSAGILDACGAKGYWRCSMIPGTDSRETEGAGALAACSRASSEVISDAHAGADRPDAYPLAAPSMPAVGRRSRAA